MNFFKRRTRLEEDRVPIVTDEDQGITFSAHTEADVESNRTPDQQPAPAAVVNNVSAEAADLLAGDRRKSMIRYGVGCLCAFASGLMLTINNFIIKETNSDFGEILAVRGIIQVPTMVLILTCKGRARTLFPAGWRNQLLALVVGFFGGMTMMTTFACVRYMPVGDAMTLIFTNPLFTMIFAAICLRHRLSVVKVIAGIGLMAGIILVIKPPFIFPPHHGGGKNVTFTNVVADYLDRGFELFDLNPDVKNWTDTTPAKYDDENDHGDLYFVGAIIALGCALFSAANNVAISRLGDDVSVIVQLAYIGTGGFIVSAFCQLFDDHDVFFTSSISTITGYQWGCLVGIALLGLSQFFCMIKSLTLVPPSTAATLRTSQIIVAFIAQACISNEMPAALDIVGALLIFFSAIAITFEKNIEKSVVRAVKHCFKCNRTSTD